MAKLPVIKRVSVKRTLRGKYEIKFSCLRCHGNLVCDREEIGRPDKCPHCGAAFKVSESVENRLAAEEKEKEKARAETDQAKLEARHAKAAERERKKLEAVQWKEEKRKDPEYLTPMQKLKKVANSPTNDILNGKAFKADQPEEVKEPSEPVGELRGRIVCSLCDCVIAEDVRLQWQQVTCPNCHALITAPGPGDSPTVQAAHEDFKGAMAKAGSGAGVVVLWITWMGLVELELYPWDSWMPLFFGIAFGVVAMVCISSIKIN